MNTGRYVLGSLVCFIFFLAFEWVVHSLILGGWYQQRMDLLRPEDQMAAFTFWMVLGFLILAFGFCYVFLKGYERKGIGEGFRYGLYVWFAFALSHVLINYAVFPWPGAWVLAWIIGALVMMVIGGIIFAAIYKPKSA